MSGTDAAEKVPPAVGIVDEVLADDTFSPSRQSMIGQLPLVGRPVHSNSKTTDGHTEAKSGLLLVSVLQASPAESRPSIWWQSIRVFAVGFVRKTLLLRRHV